MHTSPKELIPRHTCICLPQNITQCVSSYNLSVHNKTMGSDCQTQEVILGSHRRKFLVNLLTSCRRNLLHGVLLTAPGLVRVPRRTVTVAIVSDSYGAATVAGGPAELAGALISDVVIATDLLLERHRCRAWRGAAHDAVSAVGLIRHAGLGSRAHNIVAWLFALSLVHDFQVWVSHAASHKQGTLIPVRPAIAAAHSMLPGNVRAVWRAHTLRPSHFHLANLPRTAFYSLAWVFAWFAGDNTQQSQQADFIQGQAGVGPCRV